MPIYRVPPERVKPPASVPREESWFFGSLVFIIVGIVVSFLAGRNSSSLIYPKLQAILFAVLVFCAVVGAMVVVTQKKARQIRSRIREQGSFSLDNETLTSCLPGRHDIVIPLNGISRIRESKEWLSVSSSDGWGVSIPRDVEDFIELRSLLAKHCSIVHSSTGRLKFLPALSVTVAVLIVSSLMTMVFTRDHTVRLAAGLVLVASLAWQYLCAPLLRLRL